MLDRARLRQRLSEHPPLLLDREPLRPAAVLLPLFAKQGEDHLLFTVRADDLPHHRGEVSFPGGARDPEDADLLAAALRETHEEMGVAPADVTLLGRLDDVVSIHGFRVAVFVGEIPYPYPFRLNAREIARTMEIPLRALRDPAVFRVEDWTHRGRVVPVCFYAVDTDEVWGMTAEIVRQFLHLTQDLEETC